MREPDFLAADPYLGHAHAQYCEALQHLGLILAHLPNSHLESNLLAVASSAYHLEKNISEAKQAILAYTALTAHAEGEA
jgi:hypothetical protein